VITVKLVRSKIGCTPKQRKTLEALGLRKIRQEKTFEDSPVVEGMVDKVKHLVEVTKS
jgi:large subunit ribosomal protein L30